MKCSHCGFEFDGNYCPFCGTPASDASPSPQPAPSRTAPVQSDQQAPSPAGPVPPQSDRYPPVQPSGQPAYGQIPPPAPSVSPAPVQPAWSYARPAPIGQPFPPTPPGAPVSQPGRYPAAPQPDQYARSAAYGQSSPSVQYPQPGSVPAQTPWQAAGPSQPYSLPGGSVPVPTAAQYTAPPQPLPAPLSPYGRYEPPAARAAVGRKNLPTWLIGLLIVVFFPVGIPLMWAKSDWHIAVKSTLTAVFSLALVSAAVLGILRHPAVPAVSDASSQSGEETEYKNSCIIANYDDIAKEPNRYEKVNIKFDGKVLETVRENKDPIDAYGLNLSEYRIGVSNGSGAWNNDVFVTYVRPKDKLGPGKDDMVTFYGVCLGVKTYETVDGNRRTIPYVLAYYIDAQ